MDRRNILIEKENYIFGALDELVRKDIKTKYIVSNDCIVTVPPNDFYKQHIEFIFVFDEDKIEQKLLAAWNKAAQNNLQFKIAPEVPCQVRGVVHGGNPTWQQLREGKLVVFAYAFFDSKFLLNNILQDNLYKIIAESYRLVSARVKSGNFSDEAPKASN